MNIRTLSACCTLLVLTLAVSAQEKPAQGTTERGIIVRAANVYISPDTTSAKLVTLERGREMAVLERTKGWIHVLATITEQFREDRDVSGWIVDKGLVTSKTPNGDQIMYGEAVESENEASRRGGRKGADVEARRLYFRTSEYFPTSPLAAEALYRAADIQWQLDRADVDSRKRRPTSDPAERPQIRDDGMKMVIKKFKGTKQADLAALRLLENKLCLEWQAQSKCPLKEAEVYENYANDNPNSATAAEAHMEAATRYGALIEIYKTEGKANKAPEAKQKALANAQKALAKNASPDWNARAQRLIYALQNNIPVYGREVE